MRTSPFLTLFISFLALTLSSCATTGGADAAPATDDGEATTSSEGEGDGDAAASDGDAAEAPAAKGSKASKGKGAKGKSDDDEKDDDEDEEEKKKDEAEKKWEKAVEDLEETTGFFTMFHDDQKLLLQLTEKDFGRPFFYFGALNSGAGNGFIYRGNMLSDSPYVMRFERRGEKHVALTVDNTAYAEPDDAREKRMLDESTVKGFVHAFDVTAELEHEDKLLIDLGSWFMTDNFKLSRGVGSGKLSVNKDLSLFTELKSFPRNVEIYQELVFVGSRGSSNMSLADSRGGVVKVQHSLVAVPDDGYKPREFDQRVGYFYSERKNLFDRESDDPVTRYVNRWRLEKKDPTADVSEPIKPIVFWIENSTPPAFRAAVREGIEAWEPAFRKAGFADAIVAKQMPEDADWDPGDVRYAVVRWSEDENVGFAIGPSRVDPRTGEIFDADITMQANFINTYAERFETYVASQAARTKEEVLADYEAKLDPEAAFESDVRYQCHMMGDERALQLAVASAVIPHLAPDVDRQEFLHAMIRETTAHEVGHAIGLRHNFKASTWRTATALHDDEDTSTKGLTGSVMDYNPINLAPPGQQQGEFFQSVVGPYDIWAVEFGYTEFGSNESRQLDRIASRSPTPGLDFGTDEDAFIGDPYTQTWDMGIDPVEYSAGQVSLGQWGLERLQDHGAEKGEGYHKYARYYTLFMRTYERALYGLERFIGGFEYNRDLVGQENGRPPIEPIDPELQQRALDLMVDRGLKWTGGIPDGQRLLLANKKFGSFGSWFSFWSLPPLPQIVNSFRFRNLVPLMHPSLYERLGSQRRLVNGGGLDMHEVASRVFDAVWPSTPDEHDMWLQSDYVNLVTSALDMDTTPLVTALYDDLLRRSADRLESYAGSGDAATAAHGRWLGDRITRYRERQRVQF